MRRLRAWFVRCVALFGKRQRDRELSAELASHLELHIADNLRAGMSPEEARRQALIQLGGLEQTKEIYRDRRGFPGLESFAQDIRYGLRQLRRSPGFTAVAILTLALGIGANTTILSVVSGLILRDPPVHDPDGLLTITSLDPASRYPVNFPPVSAADYLDWRAQASDFSAMAAADFDDFTISGDFTPEFVAGARVTANYFNVMEVKPFLGRTFLPGEDQAGKDQAAIISARLWKEKFAGDPHILGRAIKINGNPHTIVGVMPASFGAYDSPADIWYPLVFSREELGPGTRSFRFLRVFARLKPGLHISDASAQMKTIAERISAAHPESDKNWGARVLTEQQYMTSTWNAERALAVLMIAVGLVLLIACANVASMLLARNSSRAQEFSIRTALGASRLRLSRQLLTESLLLAVAGGVLGIGFGYLGLRGILSQFNWNDTVVQVAQTISVDRRVLLLTAAISIFVALAVGIAPALRLSRREPDAELKHSGRGMTSSRQRLRLQRILVVGQIALSLILLTGASLFVEDFISEMRAATGMNPENVLTALVPTRGLDYYGAPRKQSSFFEAALRKIRESPDVVSASLTTTLPFDFPGAVNFVLEGHPVEKPADEPACDEYVVGAGYFHTLEIPLLQGREFAPSDDPKAPPVAIVDAAFAHKYFPGQDPVGKHLQIDPQNRKPAQWSEIVGVVGNVDEQLGQTAVRPHIFEPFLQQPFGNMYFVVRTRSDPAAFSDSLRQAVWSVDKAQALTEVKTMDRVILDSGQGDDIMAELMGSFAALALLMAAMGIYGVLAYLVAQRTHEIGIRMALGAEPGGILRLVFRSGGVLIFFGVAIGVLFSLPLPRLVTSTFNGFGGFNAGLLIFSMALTVTIVAFLACYIPARRAARVDPMVALRYE